MTAASVDTTLDVDVDITSDVPCEHPDHGNDNGFHGGPGELVIQCLPCPKCANKPRGIFVVCRRAYVNGGGKGQGMYCSICGWTGHRDEFWLLLREL